VIRRTPAYTPSRRHLFRESPCQFPNTAFPSGKLATLTPFRPGRAAWAYRLPDPDFAMNRSFLAALLVCFLVFLAGRTIAQDCSSGHDRCSLAHPTPAEQFCIQTSPGTETIVMFVDKDGRPRVPTPEELAAHEAAEAANHEIVWDVQPEAAINGSTATRIDLLDPDSGLPGYEVIRIPLASNRITRASANVVIVSTDGAGEGINDTTARTPVGGNTGTTLGAQRLICMETAARFWSDRLVSTVDINVSVNWTSLTCSAGSVTLGSASANTVHSFGSGAPFLNTWYHQALANKIAGSDLSGQSDLSANFNTALDESCAFPNDWYYGLDGNFGTGIDFLAVFQHEIGHGIGFSTFVDKATGVRFSNTDDVYMKFLFDETVDLAWTAMTDAQRATSVTNNGNLTWTGTNVTAEGPTVLTAGRHADGRVRMYAPTTLASGSSVSHWDTALSPNELMEPFSTNSPQNLMTQALMQDIGWGITETSEVSVTDSGTAIFDGTSTVDMGTRVQGGAALTRTFTVSNIGIQALTTSSLSVPSGYSITNTLSSSIAAGSSDTFTISLATGTAGTFAGSVSFVTNDSDENPFNFSVTGEITLSNPPEIGVADGATNVPDGTGSVTMTTTNIGGTTPTKTFTVSNTGTGSLTTSGLSVPTGYTITNTLSATIASGASDTFAVSLSTATAGTFGGEISFTNNDTSENPYNFSISGVITAPEIGVADGATNVPDGTGSVTFTSTAQGGTAPTKTFRVSNSGDGTLTTSTPTLPSGFTITESLSTSIAAGNFDDFTVSLATTSIGTFSGSLSFANNDTSENPFNFTISGTITGAEIGVTDGGTDVPDGTGSVSFATTAQGGTAPTKTFRVSNSGNVALTTATPTLPSGFSITEPLSSSIAAGTFDDFTVSLSTANFGSFSGSLSFTNNDNSENPYNFTISGTITGAEIGVTDGGTDVPDGTGNVSFGSVVLGGTSPTKTFRVSNSGNAALTPGTPSLPTGFSITEPLSSSIAAGTFDDFTVSLSTATAGAFSGSLSFTNNDTTENPYNFTISGTVTSSEIDVADGATNVADGTGSVTFTTTAQGGTAPTKTFRVSNTGASALTTSNLTVPSGYSISESLSSSIAAGSFDDFTVSLSTANIGTFSGTLSFDNNDADENPYNFSLSGTITGAEIGVTDGATNVPDGTGSVAFGTVAQGGTAITKTFRVTNSGNVALTTSTPTLPTGFSITESLNASISAGTFDDFTVSLATSAIGTFSGSLSFANNDQDENPYNFTISGTVEGAEISVADGATNVADGTGSVLFSNASQGGAAPTKTFRVTNSGNVALTLGTPTVPTGFSVTEALSGSIAAGAFDDFTVSLSTADFGTFNGTLSFTTNDQDENPYNFTILGTITGAEILVTEGIFNVADGGGPVDFGTVNLNGTALAKTFRVTNNGNASLTTSGLSVPASYSITEALNASIAAGGFDDFSVSLSSAEGGTFTGSISFANNDLDENPFNFTVTGLVTEPEISIFDGATELISGISTVGFGFTEVGQPALTKTFRVNNTGNGSLSTSGVSVPTGYSVTEALASTIGAGSFDDFTVALGTGTPGTFTGNISVTSTDADNSPFFFSVGGTILAAEITVADGATNIANGGGPINFGTVAINGTAPTKTFRVTNDGQIDLTLGTPTVPSGYTITEPLSATITNGGFDDFTVSLSTASAGTFAGSISIANNDPDENPFTFSVTGSVTSAEISVAQGATNIADGTGSVTIPAVNQGAAAPTRTFRVSNSGTSALTTSNLSVPTGFTVTQALIASIAPGAFDDFTVSLSTANIGTFTGEISFDNNDTDENPYNFTITGTVNGAEIEVADDATGPIADGSATSSFGTTSQGAPALTRTYTVNNLGNVALTTSGLTVPTGFTISEGLSASIPAGGSDEFVVTLLSTTVGTFSGTVQFTNNDQNENPFNFTISGTVNGVEIGVADGATTLVDGVSAVNFGTANTGAAALTKTFRVSNSGNIAMNVSAPSLPAGFTLTENLSGSIPAGGFDDFTVTLPTTTFGNYSGQLSITNDDLSENPFNFTISGTINGPEVEVRWGDIDLGDGVGVVDYGFTSTVNNGIAQTFRVTNLGNVALSTSGLAVPTGYVITEGLNANIAANGGFDDMTVTLSSDNAGTFTGNISFNNSDSNENPFNFQVTGTVLFVEIDVADGATNILDGSGPVSLGATPLNGPALAKTFRVTNNGDALALLGGVSVDPPFSVTEPLAADLMPGAFDDFTISMAATTPGLQTSELAFGTNDEDEGTFNFTVSGLVQAPEILVTEGATEIFDGASSSSFGSTTVGSPAITRTYRVTNNGQLPLTTSDLSVPTGFTVTNALSASIAAGAFDDITISMSTAAIGSPSGTVSFTNNDPDENPFSFTIFGEVTAAPAPEVEVEDELGVDIFNGDPYSYGTFTVGDAPIAISFRVRNTGTATLTLSNLTAPAGFSIADSLTTTIPAGSFDIFAISFDPKQVGTFSGAVSFTTNDSDENPFSFIVSATVNEPSTTPGIIVK